MKRISDSISLLPDGHPKSASAVLAMKGEGLREKETDRQTDRQTDTETDTQTERQRHREIGRERDRQTDRQTERQTDRQTDRQRDRQTDRQTERQTETETQRDRCNIKDRTSMTKGYWRGKRCCFFNKFRPLIIGVRACVCTCLRMRAPFSLSRLSLYPPTRNCFVNHCPISVHGSSQMTTLRTELKRQLKRQSPEACQSGRWSCPPTL